MACGPIVKAKMGSFLYCTVVELSLTKVCRINGTVDPVGINWGMICEDDACAISTKVELGEIVGGNSAK